MSAVVTPRPAITSRAADLEPSLAFGQTYVTRRRITRIDATALLSVMVVLILLIPARLIVPGMTDLARPGLIVGMLLFCWWVLARFSSHLAMTGPQPMRWAVLAFMVTATISYAIGFLRGLTTMEANSADRTMLFFWVFIGVLLTAADGVPNWLRLRGVLKVLVVCGALISVIAIVQYLTSYAYDLTKFLELPGLQPKGWTPVAEARGSGIRVASTATHYIELAALLSLILPFAIHFACFSRQPRRRQLALVATVVIAGGIASTISRTGLLAVTLVVVCLVPVWTWRLRYNIAVLTGGMLAALAAANPGLVTTLLHLFDNPSSNSSIRARQEDYPVVSAYFAERPWLGRGTGTYVQPQYQVLDNQWLDTLVTNGIVGVVALAGLHLTGIALAWLALRRSTTIEDRHLCAALIATQLIGIVVAGTFDSLFFMSYATILALTLGMCGTAWRLTHPHATVRTATTRWFFDRVAP